MVLQLIAKTIFIGTDSIFVAKLLIGAGLFLIPILFNRFGYLNASRLVLCWLPYGYLFFVSITMMLWEETAASTYVGIRFFFLAISCCPFVVFSLKEKKYFGAGLMAPVVSILFFDTILNLFNAGFSQQHFIDDEYFFNTIRSVIAFFIMGTCLYFLKRVAEQNEEQKERLLLQLAEKNVLIKKRADDEVHQLNEQLYSNLQQLTEREFILTQSQRIAKIGSWEYYNDEEFVFWSDEMYNIFGLDKQSKLTVDYLVQIMWGDEQTQQIIRATLSTGQPCDQVFKTKTPLGYVKWIRLYAFPILKENATIGMRGICHDITYYRESQEQMMVSEYRYRSLFEQASDAIMVTDFNGNFTEVNDSLCKMFGYSKQELLQLNISRLINPDGATANLIPELLEIGEHIIYSRPMLHKNGRVIEVEANVKKSGVDRVMAIVRDVTDLRKAVRQMEISEAKFRGAFEDSAIGMALVTLDGKWMQVNKELVNMLGYSEDELKRLTFHDISHPDDRDTDFDLEQKSLNGQLDTFKVEKRYFHKNGSIVWVNINVSVIKDTSAKPLYYVSQIENISGKKNIEFENERVRYLLNERIKELTTLSRVSHMLQMDDQSEGDTLNQMISAVTSGWQYPDIAAARIIVGNTEYCTPNFTEGNYQRQHVDFSGPNDMHGIVEVIYLQDRAMEDEGPFLKEERELINMLAEMLRIYLIRKHNDEALKESDANLHATINNTELLIWSVDRHYRILTFNKPFYEYIKQVYGIEIRTGSRIFSNVATPESEVLTKKWEQVYLQALAGEIISFEETRHGRDFKYSLSPIIEKNKVIGVSVFADNITERNARERQLSQATKQIGELKLMALRSVMNPHFIFNVLNSIQFYIAKNDRLNAINYLSTFSKLIRSILAHSVNNKVRLSEEIEMLKNYIQLEMTRFENKFNFVLNIDRNIESENIEIPSLLIQPYVENAILHGLYNKMESGTLTINVLDEKSAVVFEIYDDGIGREAAMKLREQNFPVHKSMGIKLTEERLKLINQHHNVTFEIKDLINEQGPCGTKVTIWVTV